MENPIVNRLMKNHRTLEFLKEAVLTEAEEDEDNLADDEFAALNDEEEEEHDDSQAPEQGSPEDDVPEEDTPEESPEPPSSASSHHSPSPVPDMEETPEEPVDEPEETPDRNKMDPEGYDNPLDNQYAVKFTLGDEILLAYTGASIEPRKGMIDGYDPEGFYKVRWSDGSSTNGLTDIALAELVDNKNESKCICGCTDIIKEGKDLVCDKCGRIFESKSDPLMLADKSRPKGKRMIRSEAHPVSTANKPNISMAEAIKKALKKSTPLKEDVESGYFDALKDLDNEFWSRKEEMQKDIESLGYTVDEINSEYIVVSSPEDDENAYKIPLIGTSRTMTLDISKAQMI